eukprot:3341905-Ditylum_brightwellii.AAC.1
MPLAPPETKVIVHNKATRHGSWAYHKAEGWSIAPSIEHYQCITCFMPDMAAEVDADSIKLVPHTIPIPKYGDKEAIQQAIADI